MINFSVGSVTISILLLATKSYGKCEYVELYTHLWYMAANMCTYQVQTEMQVSVKAHRCRNKCTWENVRVTYTTDQAVPNANLDLKCEPPLVCLLTWLTLLVMIKVIYFKWFFVLLPTTKLYYTQVRTSS